MNNQLTGLLLFIATSFLLTSHSAEWPQWRGPNRDGVWTETGIITQFNTSKLTPRWSVPVAAGYAGPTVADGRVYVMDRITEPEHTERVLCFDWKTGEEIWTYAYPCRYRIAYDLGPRASVTVIDGRAFSLGAMGDLHCFNAKTGNILWSKDLKADYDIDIPVWGVSPSPLVYGESVILPIGGKDSASVIALNVQTGNEIWRALDDPASYSSPIIIRQAGQDVLVCWTGSSIAGLNPVNGKTFWSYPLKPSKMVHNISTPVFNQNRLFFTSFFDGSLLLKVNETELSVDKIWRRAGENERNTDSLHSTITTPILDGDSIYGLDSYGELRGLDAPTGDRIWEDSSVVPHGRWATIHMVRNGEFVWIYNEDGELIIGKFSRGGFEEIDRTQLIEPTTKQPQRKNPINWSHPAFAYKHIFARTDKELICVDLSKND